MSKHTVRFNRSQYALILACICPQILGAFPARFWRKHQKMPSAVTHRLIWQSSPRTNSINPYYKETA